MRFAHGCTVDESLYVIVIPVVYVWTGRPSLCDSAGFSWDFTSLIHGGGPVCP